MNNFNLTGYALERFLSKAEPLINALNKEFTHLYYQYLQAISYPNDGSPMDPEEVFFLDTMWRKTRWGKVNPYSAQACIKYDGPDTDIDAQQALSLGKRKIVLSNGTVLNNPFRVTNDYIKCMCVIYQVDFNEFEAYRNKYNQLINVNDTQGLQVIDWKDFNLRQYQQKFHPNDSK